MSIHNLSHALTLVSDYFLDDLVVHSCDRQHRDAGVTCAVRCMSDAQSVNQWNPVRFIIIPVGEMFTIRSSEQVLTPTMFIPVFKEWENLVRNRNDTDSGSGFRMDNIEISFLEIDVFFLEFEQFRDSTSGIEQHEDDGIIYIRILCTPHLIDLCFAERLAVVGVGIACVLDVQILDEVYIGRKAAGGIGDLMRRGGDIYKMQTFADVLGDEDIKEPYEIASTEW